MTTMVAARLHAFGEPMRLDRIPIPEPRPTDVLVEVKACGIVPNLARVIANFFATQTPDRKGMPPLPAIFGLDPTGVITKVGDQVRSIRPGDRVYVNPARKCGSCRMCRSGQPLDCPNFTFQGYFGRSPGDHEGLSVWRAVPVHHRARGCPGQAAGQCELRGGGALRLSGHRLRGHEEARRRPGHDVPGERHQRDARPECRDDGAGDGRDEDPRHRPQYGAARSRQGAVAATDRGLRGRRQQVPRRPSRSARGLGQVDDRGLRRRQLLDCLPPGASAAAIMRALLHAAPRRSGRHCRRGEGDAADQRASG